MEKLLADFAPAKFTLWDAFWLHERRQLFGILLPLLSDVALGGVHESRMVASAIGGLGVDWLMPNHNALNWVMGRAQLDADYMTNTNVKAFKSRLADWIQTPGATIGDLAGPLYKIYGSQSRALQAAIGMVTEVYAEGSLIGWNEISLKHGQLDYYKEWETNRDDWVCPVCRPLHGQRVQLNGNFKGGLAKPRAHYGCRCWLSFHVEFPATKHASHDQSSHGNWATGRAGKIGTALIDEYGEGFIVGKSTQEFSGMAAHTWILPDGRMTGDVGNHEDTAKEILGIKPGAGFNIGSDTLIEEGFVRVQLNNLPKSRSHQFTAEFDSRTITGAQTRTLRDIRVSLDSSKLRVLEISLSDKTERPTALDERRYFGQAGKALIEFEGRLFEAPSLIGEVIDVR